MGFSCAIQPVLMLKVGSASLTTVVLLVHMWRKISSVWTWNRTPTFSSHALLWTGMNTSESVRESISGLKHK